MSVSLSIDWPDGTTEEVPISSYQGARAWGEIARSLGLVLIPQFHSFIPVELDLLDALIREITVFREELSRRGEGYAEPLATPNRLLDSFNRLKARPGWRATIG